MSRGNTEHRRLLRKSLKQRPEEATHLCARSYDPEVAGEARKAGNRAQVHTAMLNKLAIVAQ